MNTQASEGLHELIDIPHISELKPVLPASENPTMFPLTHAETDVRQTAAEESFRDAHGLP